MDSKDLISRIEGELGSSGGRDAAITNTVELRREALTALGLPDMRWRRDLPFSGDFTAREPDPAFARIAVCRRDGPVEIRAISNLAVLATLPASTNLECFGILWSADGRHLAIKRDLDGVGSRAILEVWELKDVPRRVLLIHDARHNAWSFHPHRAELIAAVQSRTIASWELSSGGELARLTIEVTPEHLKYSPDGKSVAVAYQRTDGWCVSTHEAGKPEPRASHAFTSQVGEIEWHPNGRWLAVTDFSGAVHLMDPTTGEARLLGRHRAEAVRAAFDRSGDYLVTGGWERALICWDLRAMQRAFGLEVDSYIPRFKADGSALAVLNNSGVHLYAFERPELVRELALQPASRVRHAAFSPDGRRLAASTDAGVNVFDLATDQGAFTEGAGPRLFWNSDGTELFGSSSGGGDGGATRWRVRPAAQASGPPIVEPLSMPRPAGFNSISIASNRVVWTARAGSRLAGLDDVQTPDNSWTTTLRGVNGLSPDGRWLGIYAPNTPYLHVYQTPGLARVTVITNQPRIAGFCFTPSGRELAVVSRGHVEIYSTANWQHLRGMTNVVGIPDVGVLFQPDERALWLAANLRTGALHDAQTFEALLPLPTSHYPIALSADGRKLATSVDAQRLQVWDLARVRGQLRELGLNWDH